MSRATNFVSTLNSTTTALDAAETWTGEAEYAYSHDSVVVACKTDAAGTLYIDFSTDGTNWDSTLTYIVDAGINEVHRLTITREYFRVRYVNGASAQTYLRLETMLGEFPALSAPRNLQVQQDADAIVVRPTKYEYEVATGRVQRETTWNKFGYNDDIDIGTETVWTVGGLFTPLTSASTLTVVSSSSDDDDGGTGANSIVIYGIDADREAVIEVVTLNGTGSVVTTNSFLGVNRAAIYAAGSGGTNAGTITITATTGGATQAAIPIGSGTTQHAFFFVQAGHTALMDWLYININKLSGGTSPRVTVKAFVTSLVSRAKYEVFRTTIDTSVENTIELRPSQPFVVGEKSLLEFQATTDTNNTVAAIRFSFIEVKN